MIDLVAKETEIVAGLKDFQRATVNRVCHLFQSKNSRVLVADEVGLGKTLIAKGVIAKTARYQKEVLSRDLFKVVYVCSNQSIAGQNLAKLKIDDNITVDGLSDTRLSMQHLKIFEQDYDPSIREKYIQLIPLTPTTSFTMTGGGGSVRERALMFAILKRYHEFTSIEKELEVLMTENAVKAWGSWARDRYEERVIECDELSDGLYLSTILQEIESYLSTHQEVEKDVMEICEMIRNNGNGRIKGSTRVIHKLRMMMAQISVKLMNPDLVIMDEFQRFPDLIDTNVDNETAMLARKFFNSSTQDDQKVNILLLSATPYKLYSTLEEINETKSDEHYKEFMQVINFLYENEPNRKAKFKQVWNDYSVALSEVSYKNFSIISAKKQKAEDYLYGGICRTERMVIDGASELVDAPLEKGQLDVTENDILAYIEADQLLQGIELKDKVPLEYIKSAPFIMSYMHHYKLKHKVFDFFKTHPNMLNLAKKNKLWVDKTSVSKYKALPNTNAKLQKLKEVSLPEGAEKLMWIPPSRPYYECAGCFKGQQNFSKVLAFSAWEMVPRAIATMLSYEAERLTVGKLMKQSGNKKESRSYFAKKRFPAPRLKFAIKDHEPSNMNFLCLLYPSITLAKLFDPIETLNQGKSLADLRAELREKLEDLLEDLLANMEYIEKAQDDSWYYIAPLLFDMNEERILEWFENPHVSANKKNGEGVNDEGDDKGAYAKHIAELKKLYLTEGKLVLGKRPPDLLEVLVNMAIGSPAISALRMFGPDVTGSAAYAVHLGKTIVDRFNAPEAIATIELEYGNQDPYWQNVLKYCVDGNIQAMIDEYAHMLEEGHGLIHSEAEKRNKNIADMMITTLKTHTASYNVDTFPTFRDRVMSGKKKKTTAKESYMKMRSNYAVGFYDTKNEDKSVQRKDNIRLSFNSPFRPFVLATTSIGQEGLDFHYYCRKIVHWNLPSNPIDLEQREGRINRYKCLAIRQNVARKYGDLSFQSNVWKEMFEAASSHEKNEGTCDLVPFWCLPGNQDVKIERIVPVYPMSRDGAKYERLIKVLSLYRLSLGQARQEELLEYLFENDMDQEKLKELFINLSPFYKGDKVREIE